MTTTQEKKRLKTCVVCRTNGPLLQMGWDVSLRCPDAKILFLGRDIAKRLKDAVAEVLEWRRNCDIEEFVTLLESWINEIRKKCEDKDSKEGFLAECEDDYVSLSVFAQKPGVKDAKGVMTKIDETFVDAEAIDPEDDKIIVFASGHRSKGLEWDRVIVIRADLMPHPAAELPADLEQEDHIEYVSYTRGKEVLIVCHDKHPDPDDRKK